MFDPEMFNGVGTEIQTILVICNPHKMDSLFHEKSMRFLNVHFDVIKDDIDNRTPGQKRPEFAVVFGGDGTMLRAAQALSKLDFPLPAIGVNLGTVGFLTEISPDKFEEQMAEVVFGGGQVSNRMMLQCSVGDNKGDPFVALNDIVIQGKGQVTLDFEICIDGIEVADFRGDGLIISTPSGSTGYNLSAGGPLISPGVNAIAVTAICPHSLTTRPVVVGADEIIKIRLPKDTFRGREPVVIVDGQVSDELTCGDEIEIRRHRNPFRLLQLNPRGHYQTMRDKLHWGRSIKHG